VHCIDLESKFKGTCLNPVGRAIAGSKFTTAAWLFILMFALAQSRNPSRLSDVRIGPILLKKSQVKARQKSAQIRSTSMIDYCWPRNSIWSDPHRVGAAQ
jgi:hypothetical protein